MPTPLNRATLLAAAAAMAMAAGCGQAPAGPETVEVTGMVTLDGEPVSDAIVTFIPAEESVDAAPAQAIADAAGEFEVSSIFEQGKVTKRGMMPGTYAVTVTKLETSSDAGLTRPPNNLLPKRYAAADSSGLTATVSPEAKNDVRLELKKN